MVKNNFFNVTPERIVIGIKKHNKHAGILEQNRNSNVTVVYIMYSRPHKEAVVGLRLSQQSFAGLESLQQTVAGLRLPRQALAGTRLQVYHSKNEINTMSCF